MTRACGDCQLCCKLLPMKEGFLFNGRPMPGNFDKPAGERCPHQRHHKGCAIYARRPHGCRVWTCAWLDGEDTGSRPDRVHYVVDTVPDFITVVDNDNARETTNVPVVQIWVDPDYPDAHHDPALRAWLEKLNLPALIRHDNRRGFVLFPPGMMSTGQWHEQHSSMSQPQHTAAEIAQVLRGKMVRAGGVGARPGPDRLVARIPRE